MKLPESGAADARELFVRHAKKDGRSVAVLTAVDSMKMIGYSVGAAGFVLLLILRYWRRPPPTASNETPPGVVEA